MAKRDDHARGKPLVSALNSDPKKATKENKP
jgi:hypothetical protein